MIDYHIETGADLTVGALRVTRQAATEFGVMGVDRDNRIMDFQEKVPAPPTIPGDPDHCLGSMGIYVSSARFLFEQLCQDATRANSRHDFGHNIIPAIIDRYRVMAYSFQDENRKLETYWRDVGTLDAYYEANMDLVSIDPQLNLYDQRWPIRTYQPSLPPPKFVFNGQGDATRCGRAMDSIICSGSIVSGGQVERSVLGWHTRVNSYAHVEDSILFDNVEVGRHCRVRRAIIDKGIHIPPGVEIGYDLDQDRERGFTVSEGGVVVLASSDGIEQLNRSACLT
jgi:glucose-1-phosphate adenylyltransferase